MPHPIILGWDAEILSFSGHFVILVHWRICLSFPREGAVINVCVSYARLQSFHCIIFKIKFCPFSDTFRQFLILGSGNTSCLSFLWYNSMLSKITIFPVSQTAKTELQNTELKIVWEVCCQQEKLAHQIGAGTIEFQVGAGTMEQVSTRPNI